MVLCAEMILFEAGQGSAHITDGYRSPPSLGMNWQEQASHFVGSAGILDFHSPVFNPCMLFVLLLAWEN